MATLTVATTTNFSNTVFSPEATLIDFTNAAATDVTATFAAGQFNDINISKTVAIDGSVGVNHMVIGMRAVLAFDMSGMVFTNWASFTDTITIQGGAGNNTLTGSTQRDTINGGDGSDTIRGLGNSDILNGDAGLDTFLYKTGDVISTDVIDGGADADTIKIDGTGTFDFNSATITAVEKLLYANSLTSALVKLNTGDFGAGKLQTVTGNASVNALDLIGGPVNLTTIAFNSWTDVTDTITVRATFDGNYTGTNFAETFQDQGAAVVFNGQGGDDTFRYFINNSISFSGDSLIGGLGTDTLTLQSFSGGLDLRQANSISGIERLEITEANFGFASIGFSQITGFLAVDNQDPFFTLKVAAQTGTNPENVDLTAIAFTGFDVAGSHLEITGNSGANTITGGTVGETISSLTGNDTVQGGAGADTMDGGGDNDTLTYAASALGVKVTLGSGVGTGGDAAGDTNVNFENLTGSSRADTLNGDGNANVITGGNGNDKITAGAGGDNLDGGDGLDTLNYGNSIGAVTVDLALNTASGGDADSDTFSNFENLFGSAQADTLGGSVLANVLKGQAGGDTINGNAGNDTIIGGAGQDDLAGGADGDIFVYEKINDSKAGIALRDIITDFTQGSDKLNLTAIDANTGGGTANDAFILVTGEGSPFSGAAGEIRFAFQGANTLILINTDAGLAANMHILLNGHITLTGADFNL